LRFTASRPEIQSRGLPVALGLLAVVAPQILFVVLVASLLADSNDAPRR
jgi:hypothetical protein